MDKPEELYKLAESFCSYITQNVITNETIPVLMEYLMQLYLSALHLPEPTQEALCTSLTTDSETFSIRFSEQVSTSYWEIFDPFVFDEPVCGNLLDDLSDIAFDLKRGMREFEAGQTENAIFEWKLGLDSHWGSHAVDALRALHTIRTRLAGFE